MRIYNYFLIVTSTLLYACSKNDYAPVVPKLNPIDGYSIAQVDSIARHYGWTFTPGDTAKGKQTMKIQDFINLAEGRIANGLNARKINIEGTLTFANTVLGAYPNDGNTFVGLGGQNAPLYNLTWKFPNLKSMAFPSIYNMTFSVYSDIGSEPQVGGADFMYDGADGPILNTDWAYQHQGSTISGLASAFYVQNYGTEHETVHVLGGTIQRHYVVQFKINGQNVANVLSPVNAVITLTLLN
ncbi:hypothetical protein HGH93_06035 [Chitinophaga polysaccharea]|uniref:hypothetical protein n=1 Tax=Chitinophaga polysaccharea TaxID=1293035 RepID=UPI0014555823|nr:hypothetical protein [Chitinophaga polysaccharea]NLR57648.1 hypothetical protein [Chitinophaga polysaccharea]